MKVLLLDIETAPNLAYVWGLWDQNVATSQVVNSGYVLCWAAKWLDEETVIFDSVHKSGEVKMLKHIHNLLSEADVVVTHNGIKFDLPTLNKEFILKEMQPPSPYKQVDTLLACRKMFRFASNKLDFVAQSMGLGNKVKHSGFELWVNCMKGDPDAWDEMETYNRQDVVLLESLYKKLLPWIPNHPNQGIYDDKDCCPNCGSSRYQRRGTAVSRATKYIRYQCRSCGHWFKSKGKAIHTGSNFRQITT